MDPPLLVLAEAETKNTRDERGQRIKNLDTRGKTLAGEWVNRGKKSGDDGMLWGRSTRGAEGEDG
jgi:hypothetical protein